MTHSPSWKPSLRAFFAGRAEEVEGSPSVEDLCYVAGRDPRVWSDPAMRDDLAVSIVTECGAGPTSSVLEVGCAAGFLAQLVAPRVGRYVGVDLADEPLRVARRLGLPNATFGRADGTRLRYADASFDAAFCYDVFTNFPTFEDGAGIIAEMIRVVRPGGRVLVGSIPDAATEAQYQERVTEVARELDARYGPLPQREAIVRPDPLWRRLLRRIRGGGSRPEILCFYFRREDFQGLGARIAADVEIHDIHRLNPYHGLRFNALYRRGSH